MILKRLSLRQFAAARRWARRHPNADPFREHRAKEWCFVAAAEQLRLKSEAEAQLTLFP